jgi:TolB-like protein/DNA-binding SARP family transcriptional activator
MTRTLRLRVLGPFDARWSDGESAELRNKKARALLAYLAVEHGRSHARERLAGMLWGETGDERARHNLRQSLSAIRRSCGPVIVSRGDLLELDQTRCRADVIDFERLARAEEPDELLQCVDLYRGDLLEDFEPREPVYDEWLNLARARLRRIACQVVDDLVDSLAVEGRYEEAIQALERRLSMDPCCEAAHRRLMELFAKVGRRTDALRQYRSCVETLERELGAEPDVETKKLHASLQRSQPLDAAEPPDPSAAPGEATRPRLAILPFDNLSAGADDYFVDGIVEDLTTALSCFHSLVVIARGAAFAYRGRDVPERQIADELGVQFLVRGSVRRAAQKVRVNIQLLDAFASSQLWGHRFDRDLEDLFEVQDEITSTVVSTLVGKVEGARLTHARGAPTRLLDAYDLYLRGKDHHHRYTAEDCRVCIDLFNRAIERDPDFAVAYAWLACGLGQAMVFELDEQAGLVDRCQAAAERGLELDANESECHRVLAQVFLTRRNLTKSLWHQKRALFLNPNDDRSVCAMGEILTFVGRHQEAEDWIRKSMQLNPYHSPRYWTHLGRCLIHLGRFEEALDALEKVPRPRHDNLVYRVVASARREDALALQNSLSALREAIPAFEPSAFAASLPYEREEDRQIVLGALRGAGSSD